MGFLYNNFLADFFLMVMRWVFTFVGEYSLVIVIVTVVIRAVLLPLDIFNRKNSRKMTIIQPEMAELKKRYGNNPQLMQKKQKELYHKVGYRPSAGCLPMLLQMLIFFAFFGAMRVLVSEQTIGLLLNGIEAGGNLELPSWLWVHNFWQPDSGLASILPAGSEFISTLTSNSSVVTPQQLSILAQQNLITFRGAGLSIISETYDTLCNKMIAFNGLTDYKNGWFIVPVLSGVAMFMQQWIQKKQGVTGSDPSTGGAMKGMMYIFPLITVWICCTSNTAFALYWFSSNAYALIQQTVLGAIEKSKYNKSRPKPIKEATTE